MLGNAGVLWNMHYSPIEVLNIGMEVLSYNACVMMGLSKIPDEFFEEYEKLDEEERRALHEILVDANLPSLYVLV